jgi:hypothetical protein
MDDLAETELKSPDSIPKQLVLFFVLAYGFSLVLWLPMLLGRSHSRFRCRSGHSVLRLPRWRHIVSSRATGESTSQLGLRLWVAQSFRRKDRLRFTTTGLGSPIFTRSTFRFICGTLHARTVGLRNSAMRSGGIYFPTSSH